LSIPFLEGAWNSLSKSDTIIDIAAWLREDGYDKDHVAMQRMVRQVSSTGANQMPRDGQARESVFITGFCMLHAAGDPRRESWFATGAGNRNGCYHHDDSSLSHWCVQTVYKSADGLRRFIKVACSQTFPGI
jgi:hypothetical protein